MTVSFATFLSAAAVLGMLAAVPAAAQLSNTCTVKDSQQEAMAPTKPGALNVLGNFEGFVMDDCVPGYKCPAVLPPCDSYKWKCQEKDDGMWTCTIRCDDADSAPCTEVACGCGDPHIRGFDGTQFDFHGTPGGTFALFGHTGGDLLVAKLRSYAKSFRMSDGSMVDGTLFKEFGLQVGGSDDKVKVSMRSAVKTTRTNKAWRLYVETNDCEVVGEAHSPTVSIKFHNDRRVQVDTAAHVYTLRLVDGESDGEGHLDVEVGMKAPTSKHSADYLGVLGSTLNRKLGKAVHPDMAPTARDIDRERAFTQAFKTDGLFPKHDSMSGGLHPVHILDHVSRALSGGAGEDDMVDLTNVVSRIKGDENVPKLNPSARCTC